mmetsp:Transcript_64508/g.120027  ORF Transcript_64508/g.120027 Transcript_64508/m.120027 type:complete len:286 (-) Transcript_64508:8-865(-)
MAPLSRRWADIIEEEEDLHEASEGGRRVDLESQEAENAAAPRCQPVETKGEEATILGCADGHEKVEADDAKGLELNTEASRAESSHAAPRVDDVQEVQQDMKIEPPVDLQSSKSPGRRTEERQVVEKPRNSKVAKEERSPEGKKASDVQSESPKRLATVQGQEPRAAALQQQPRKKRVDGQQSPGHTVETTRTVDEVRDGGSTSASKEVAASKAAVKAASKPKLAAKRSEGSELASSGSARVTKRKTSCNFSGAELAGWLLVAVIGVQVLLFLSEQLTSGEIATP